MSRIDWSSVVAHVREGKKFFVTTHMHPDGDALGAQIAMTRILRSLGKEAHAVSADEVPQKYLFMHKGEVEPFTPGFSFDADHIFILDVAHCFRLGELAPGVEASRALKIFIDHHPLSENPCCDIEIVDTSFSSTSEMILDLSDALGVKLTKAMAEPLYVGIVTDTGRFSFQGASPAAHRATARLLEAGVDHIAIDNTVYHQSSTRRLKLMGAALERLESVAEGKVLYTYVPYSEMKAMGVIPEEMEGFIDVMRTSRDAEIFAIFWQPTAEDVKVSIRSRGKVLVNEVAEKLGGGGHPFAAGMLKRGKLKNVMNETVKALVQKL